MAAVAGIVIGSVSLTLTLMVYVYGAWRHFRPPRFWVTFASASVEALQGGPTNGPGDLVQIKDIRVEMAYTGGGRERNIIDTAFVNVDSRSGISGDMDGRTMPVPAELAGRLTLEFSGGIVVGARTELLCVVRLDCGREYFDVPLTFRQQGDTYIYMPVEIMWEMFSLPTRRSRFGRLLRRRDRR